MMTCAHAAQAVGIAAALCRELGVSPRELTESERMTALQRRLLRTGQHIPHIDLKDTDDLANQARLTASSEYLLSDLPPSGERVSLDIARALLFPVQAGAFPRTTLYFSSKQATTVEIQLRGSERDGNFTPDTILATCTIPLHPGEDLPVTLPFNVTLDRSQYVFLCVMRCEDAELAVSAERVSGVLSLVHRGNPKVAKKAIQAPPDGIGFDTFEFWLPLRRPAGQLLAAHFDPPVAAFGAEQLSNAYTRPFITSNMWVAAKEDPAPTMTFTWDQPREIRRIDLFFDVDYDHAMETAQYGHPERTMPFCVQGFRLLDADGNILHEETDNHQAVVRIDLPEPCQTDKLLLEITATHGCPAAVARICVY
jgi:hypothetical protein